MQVDATTAATPIQQSQQTAESSALGQLGTDAFLKLLVAQLRYQNPMQPGDGTEMLQQTAQFTTVETLQAISETNQQLMGLTQVSLAMSSVGKSVSAIDVDGGTVYGTVHGVRFTADGPYLNVDGNEIPLDNVLTVAQ